MLGQDSYAKAMARNKQAARFITANLREGSRSALSGTLAVTAVLRLILGRSLKR